MPQKFSFNPRFKLPKLRPTRLQHSPCPPTLWAATQAMYFIAIMLVIAFGFYIWNVVEMVSFHAPTSQIVIKVGRGGVLGAAAAAAAMGKCGLLLRPLQPGCA